MSLLNDTVNFAALYAQWIGEGLHPVEKAKAQSRANICLMCPKNQKRGLVEVLKMDAASLVRKQIELKNRMKLRVDDEKSLHICDVCHCVLSLKAWTPMTFIEANTSPETMLEFPSNCWIPIERICNEIIIPEAKAILAKSLPKANSVP